MISSIVASSPSLDFRVVYVHGQREGAEGTRRTFERRAGATLRGSDVRLQEPPPFLVARLCMFRAIPLDLDAYNA